MTRIFVRPPILEHLPAPRRYLHSRQGGSSLKGQRSIADFFYILDQHIEPVNSSDYNLQKLDNECLPLADPPIERSFSGNIKAGSYLISKFPGAINVYIMLTSLQRLQLILGRSCTSRLLHFSIPSLWPREQHAMEEGLQQVKSRAG